MFCSSPSALRPASAKMTTARIGVVDFQTRVNYLDVMAELEQRKTPLPPFASRQGAYRGDVFGLESEPASMSEFLPSFDTLTAELRRRAVDAGSRPQLLPSVALPLIFTLSSLLWVVILKGLDFGSLL